MDSELKVWKSRYADERTPRRLLACDGGGIRGIISIEILAEIESQLKAANGAGDDFRLGDYFDYVAGTSTGAIIATGLAVGMSMSELRTFYIDAGPAMFESQWLLKRARALYKADPLREKLQEVLWDQASGRERTLGADDLRCLLLIVTRNATTDSPWPLSNNPLAKYNDRSRPDCNLNIPLWELVRASTAAPIYFPPEELQFGDEKSFTFVDGGVTPYNNPAFLLYRMATAPQYRLNWQQGERSLMLMSVGTGAAEAIDLELDEAGRNAVSQLAGLPGILMGGSAVDQDVNCRAVGRCVSGHLIDREVGDMIPRDGDDPLSGPITPLESDKKRAFLYARYNPDLSKAGLTDLGLGQINPKDVQALDKVDKIEEMQAVGRAYAKKHVDVSSFGNVVKKT